jgi:hypothetical protein
VSVHKKDGKTERIAGTPPPTVNTVVGVPTLSVDPPLDLDMEELSGSLLLEEPLGRGALIGARSASPPGYASPFLPATSSLPPRSVVAMPKLPKPTPPPRHDATGLTSEPRPPPAAPDSAPDADALETLVASPFVALPSAPVAEPLSPVDRTPTQPPTSPSPAVDPTRRAITSPLAGDVEVTNLPRGALDRILRAVTRGARRVSTMLRSGDSQQGWRNRSALAIIAVAGLAAGVVLVVLAVTAIRGREVPSRTSASPVERGSSPTPVVASAISSGAPAAGPATAGCTVAGAPHVVAPSAVVATGIEVRAFGDDIALGFAPSDHEAMLVRLNPLSLSAAESTVVRSQLPVRRVTPIPGKKGRLGLAIDVDRKGDPLHGRRTLPLDPPVQVGVADGQLAWAPWERGVQGKLWPLDGEGAVEALRGARSESNLAMVAIAFRRAGSVWFGTAERSTTLTPKGDLSRVVGLGPTVGAPAVAINDGIVIMAWADRPSSDRPWRLRWTRSKAGEPSVEESTFEPPPGGKGGEAMSPGLAVLPGGRFLLVWSEGPTSAHEVRALTLSAEGLPLGAPLAVSGDGVNAGQGQVAVTESGRGVVAFLESRANGFRVAATPIACAP